MNRANTYRNIYEELSGVYTPGAFKVIETKFNEQWKQMVSKEDEINMNWDRASDEQFSFMCTALKKLMLRAILGCRLA